MPTGFIPAAVAGPSSLMRDGAGGIIFPGTDGTHQITSHGPRRITRGAVIATGKHHLQRHPVEPASLRSFRGPVYLALGGRSNPVWLAQAAQLQVALPQTIIDTYPDRHHLDLPHHAEVDRPSRALIDAWNLG